MPGEPVSCLIGASASYAVHDTRKEYEYSGIVVDIMPGPIPSLIVWTAMLGQVSETATRKCAGLKADGLAMTLNWAGSGMILDIDGWFSELGL